MMEGDLVKMNLQVQNSQNTKVGSSQQNIFYPVMGLVESIRFYDPQLHGEILRRFPQLGKCFIESFSISLLSLIILKFSNRFYFYFLHIVLFSCLLLFFCFEIILLSCKHGVITVIYQQRYKLLKVFFFFLFFF